MQLARRHLVFSALSGALLTPSLVLANSPAGPAPAGWQGKYVTLRTPKAIAKYKPRMKVNMEAFNNAFRIQAANHAEANSVQVKLPGGPTIVAPTHLFEKTLVVPYADTKTVKDARGVARRGETELNKLISSGEVLFAVKNHRNGNPVVDMAGNAGKEALKFEDSHAQYLVGVNRRENGKNQRGVITFNNPQSYPGGEAGPGRFGNPTYNSIAFRPKYPAYLLGKKTDGSVATNPESRSLVRAFNNNIRTMLLGFNAVTEFPGDYNGGDPLGAFDPQTIKVATRHMINGIAGSAEEKSAARAFFGNPDNQVYCAELGFVAASAALHVPLNRSGVSGLGVTEQTWARFKTAVAQHNRGESTPFTSMNDNGQVAHVNAAISPKSLKPMWAYAPSEIRQVESQKMAFRPMTSADIVGEFLRLHIDRKQLGEQTGSAIQAGVLKGMRPGLEQMLAISDLPATHPKRAGFERIFGTMTEKVGTAHASYEAFKTALAPAMEAAREATGPQAGGRPGEGLFFPPHGYHVMAKGFGKGEGLLELEYAFHKVHYSQMEQASNR